MAIFVDKLCSRLAKCRVVCSVSSYTWRYREKTWGLPCRLLMSFALFFLFRRLPLFPVEPFVLFAGIRGLGQYDGALTVAHRRSRPFFTPLFPLALVMAFDALVDIFRLLGLLRGIHFFINVLFLRHPPAPRRTSRAPIKRLWRA
jgi:hypothetical protein